ncbi:hypothetical protein OsI_12426 [Oryza sativa Indica Group]|uniref:FRIGIDA-like protein n=1 Tax=Oryza sativa subsp. indica TaxID=39946 RepID=B8ALQ3_ORYSI|nr:hypothetical protein OsI_12426 [Oryza sativa Indica Group]
MAATTRQHRGNEATEHCAGNCRNSAARQNCGREDVQGAVSHEPNVCVTAIKTKVQEQDLTTTLSGSYCGGIMRGPLMSSSSLELRREHIDAVKVARAFNLIDKFPPVSVIKAYVEKVKEAAQDMDRAMQEDVAALRSAKEAIEAHDSGSDYRYTIMQEVHKLMRSYEKKKRSLSFGSTSSSHEHKNKRHRSNQAMPRWENQTIPGPPVYFPVPPPYFGHYNPYHPFGPQPRRN